MADNEMFTVIIKEPTTQIITTNFIPVALSNAVVIVLCLDRLICNERWWW